MLFDLSYNKTGEDRIPFFFLAQVTLEIMAEGLYKDGGIKSSEVFHATVCKSLRTLTINSGNIEEVNAQIRSRGNYILQCWLSYCF